MGGHCPLSIEVPSTEGHCIIHQAFKDFHPQPQSCPLLVSKGCLVATVLNRAAARIQRPGCPVGYPHPRCDCLTSRWHVLVPQFPYLESGGCNSEGDLGVPGKPSGVAAGQAKGLQSWEGQATRGLQRKRGLPGVPEGARGRIRGRAGHGRGCPWGRPSHAGPVTRLPALGPATRQAATLCSRKSVMAQQRERERNR